MAQFEFLVKLYTIKKFTFESNNRDAALTTLKNNFHAAKQSYEVLSVDDAEPIEINQVKLIQEGETDESV